MAEALKRTAPRHRVGRASAGVAVVAIALALTGCIPKGQALVKVTGNVNAETSGKAVSCPKPTGGVTQVIWDGMLAGHTTKIVVFSGVEGDLDAIQFTHNGKTYQRLDHDLRTVDSSGTVHVDALLSTSASPPRTVQLVASLRCP